MPKIIKLNLIKIIKDNKDNYLKVCLDYIRKNQGQGQNFSPEYINLIKNKLMKLKSEFYIPFLRSKRSFIDFIHLPAKENWLNEEFVLPESPGTKF